MAKGKMKAMTGERKNRIKEMLSSRDVVEKDNSPMMMAANKMRMAKGKGGKY